MRRHRGSRRKRKTSVSFRFGVDQTPGWMNDFIRSKYAIPCSAKIFGPNNRKIQQKWLFIENERKQLASKGDIVTLTRQGTLEVRYANKKYSDFEYDYVD